MQGKLFAREFLEVGITETAAWASQTAANLDRFRTDFSRRLARISAAREPNEAVTERQVIIPVLEALGWPAILPQQTVSRSRRLDTPDLLLFQSDEEADAAQQAAREADRYRHGVAIAESKRWDRALDRASQASRDRDGTPSTQILRYLSLADVQSNGRIRWGMLTHGRVWRLYWQGARSRSEDFLEIDLGACVGLKPDGTAGQVEANDPDHWLRVFALLFSPAAFAASPEDAENRSLLELAQVESRHWEARVSEELGEVVLNQVFPELVAGLVARDAQRPSPLSGTYLDEARQAALTLLYRMLFVLYAEDRHLLPATGSHYDDYSLRAIREDAARRVDNNDVFSASACRYFDHFTDLCRAINVGDPSIGLPAYDGGLFDPEAHPILARTRIPDSTFAPALDKLARRLDGDRRKWINYRELSVQHLGSIYERLLEVDVVAEGDQVTTRPNAYARRVTGSYYTHDDLVKLIISRAVAPHIAEIKDSFRRRVSEISRGGRRSKSEVETLKTLDPASRIVSLAVCDPAMGSGHFLVALVDHFADEALQAVAEAESDTSTAGIARYRSPLLDRFETTRRHILRNAEQHGWSISPEQLDDRHLVRRMVLKRAVYGVDKNPMAVELAKVALWLHTFTVGAPLSFLDHHLRCGDSLFGEWLEDVGRDLGSALFLGNALAAVDTASRVFEDIAQRDDADIADVEGSKALFAQGQRQLEPLRRLCDFWQGTRWLRARDGRQHPGVTYLLTGFFGDLLGILVRGNLGEVTGDKGGAVEEAQGALTQTRVVADKERFFHWELAFPTIWQKGGCRQGPGFDVVVGNPPWDRVKLQEVEWFAARRQEIAAAQRASDRKRMIEALRKAHDPLWDDYSGVKERSETAAQVARECEQYPLLSGGDINLYSLFVERVARLVNEQGTVGLLTPSGIAADATAAPFFREIATTGRLAALLDFENKRHFFPDIHASFKFSTLVFGGRTRTFDSADCGFFLHTVSELSDTNRVFPLGPSDFAAVNPNTGTAPVFRTRRDAEITTAIYQRLPILVDRRGSGVPKQVWPVRYLRMFDMTNDSRLFKTARELQDAGFYPVEGNRWRRAREEYVPLYEGKMVQMYDHRGASVVVNPENLHRPAQPEPATLEQHRDRAWLPTPQFWVPAREVLPHHPAKWALCFKEITAPTNRRTVIAAFAPAVGFGNKVPLLLPPVPAKPREHALQWACLAASMNSFALDFVARQKVHGQTINLFILEQLPFVPRDRFEEVIAKRTIGSFVASEVLRLTFTAEDLRPLAIDLGYTRDPFPWDEQDRRHRMARLDALFFQLYGIERTDADYILNQFPIVRADDEREFGRFLTRDLILAYMSAIAAGDLSSTVRLT
jgi:hypothetical protein